MRAKEEERQYFVICREADVACVTHGARVLAKLIGFNEILQCMIATATSELATNIVKYAGRGSMIVAVIHQMDQAGIEVVAEDRGPGIDENIQALSDHVSTGNTLGIGLPGVKRLMDEFSIDSSVGVGTKIVTRKWKPTNVTD